MLGKLFLIKGFLFCSLVVGNAGLVLAEEKRTDGFVSLVPEGAECLMLIGSLDCESKGLSRGVSGGVVGVCKSRIAFKVNAIAEEAKSETTETTQTTETKESAHNTAETLEVVKIKTKDLERSSIDNRDTTSPIGFVFRLGAWVVTGGLSEYWGKHLSANSERSRAAHYMTYLLGVKLKEDMRLAGISECQQGFKDNSAIINETSSVEAH